MAWKPVYVLIIIAISLIDYSAGRLMGAAPNQRRRKLWLLLSLASNIGILFVFKYFNFIFESIQDVMHAFGSSAHFPMLSLLLPIGLSFHTFQSISYTIDVYLRRVEPVTHLGKFALYVSFFPQLVAGPIERGTGLLPQFFENRMFDLNKARHGLKLMAWGFFKKLVIADQIAPFVATAYASPHSFTGPSLLIATFLFSYQIYCDFSGYTDIARGAANILGYDLRMNFDRPYASRSVSEFWRRWHMSLSSWFRDYVYIPLGGSRVGQMRYVLNIMITFLLCGLWHGANWTFVIWGALNGVYLVVGHFTESFRMKLIVILGTVLPAVVIDQSRRLTTFLLISIGWIFFRSSDAHTAWYILTHVFSGGKQFLGELAQGNLSHAIFIDNSPAQFASVLKGIIILEFLEWLIATGKLSQEFTQVPRAMRFFVYVLATLTIFLMSNLTQPQQFIYFRF